MTIDGLRDLLDHACWFQRLGQFEGREETVSLRDLEAWRSQDPVADEAAEKVAEAMEWLPTKVDEADPIHGQRITNRAHELGKEEELRQQGTAAYKLALTSLRGATEHPLLRVGPHNFFQAAKGAAAYAVRAAAGEIVVDQPGKWCALVNLYAEGFWPCGILPDRRIVVL